MPRYTCKHCGETCSSKNPTIRSVFPDDEKSAILSHMVNIDTAPVDGIPETWDVTIQVLRRKGKTNVDAEHAALKLLRGLSEENIKHWLCEHQWQIIPGTGDELQPY